MSGIKRIPYKWCSQLVFDFSLCKFRRVLPIFINDEHKFIIAGFGFNYVRIK